MVRMIVPRATCRVRVGAVWRMRRLHHYVDAESRSEMRGRRALRTPTGELTYRRAWPSRSKLSRKRRRSARSWNATAGCFTGEPELVSPAASRVPVLYRVSFQFSTLPLARRRIASFNSLSFVSSRLADSIQAIYRRRCEGASASKWRKRFRMIP